MISVLVVSFNTRDLIAPMMQALQVAMQDQSYEVIFVDNASSDGSAALIAAQYPQHRLLVNTRNVGFGRANNQAAAVATGEFLLLLNTDAFVAADTVSRTIGFMREHPDCGILGVKLVGRDNELQPSCRYFPTPLRLFLGHAGLTHFVPESMRMDNLDWAHDAVRECDWVPGCYILMRRTVYQAIGLFDARYFLYYEEVDLCRQTKRAGWKVYFYPDTTVVHIGGESAKTQATLTSGGRQISALQVESELLYTRKFYGAAGLLLHLCLQSLGDCILLFKNILKFRPSALSVSVIAAAGLRNRLACKTSFGTRPTR
jgi:GT2 family glycosyltransferase